MSLLARDQLTAGATATPVPSATVILLRDAPGGGMEVLLQERTLRSDFAGGAYVFPGGKVDPRDARMPPDVLGPVDAGRLQRQLGTSSPTEAIALAVAGVREAWEEAGVLLATRGGRRVDHDLVTSVDATALRADLAARDRDVDWRPWLREHELVLDLATLAPFAWWITPHGLHRRYSTRFFVTRVPPEQAQAWGHDGREMTDSVWLAPRRAAEAGATGERSVIYPTRRTLERLAGYPDVAAVLAAAADGRVDLRPIVPLLRRGPDGLGVQHPDGGPVELP